MLRKPENSFKIINHGSNVVETRIKEDLSIHQPKTKHLTKRTNLFIGLAILITSAFLKAARTIQRVTRISQQKQEDKMWTI